MNVFSIKSSDDVEVNFSGELIDEVESIVTLEDDCDRKFVIRVYAIESGGFIPTIEYQSNCPFERSVVWFEETDVFEDVEKFFYAFDVSELMLPAKGISHQEKENHRRIIKKLAKNFEPVMFKFLDDAKQKADQNGFVDRAQEPSKPGSIWGLFKIK